MRLKRPRVASLDEVRITREPEAAGIDFLDTTVASTHFVVGPRIQSMTDAEVLELFNDTIRARDRLAATYHHVAVEIPPGEPQLSFFEEGGYWTPRADVLRCVVEGDGLDGGTFVYVDDQELTLSEFGILVRTYAGWGMRIVFVPDDETEKTPEIEVRLPDD